MIKVPYVPATGTPTLAVKPLTRKTPEASSSCQSKSVNPASCPPGSAAVTLGP